VGEVQRHQELEALALNVLLRLSISLGFFQSPGHEKTPECRPIHELHEPRERRRDRTNVRLLAIISVPVSISLLFFYNQNCLPVLPKVQKDGMSKRLHYSQKFTVTWVASNCTEQRYQRNISDCRNVPPTWSSNVESFPDITRQSSISSCGCPMV
jgi:hypothetical protein